MELAQVDVCCSEYGSYRSDLVVFDFWLDFKGFVVFDHLGLGLA